MNPSEGMWEQRRRQARKSRGNASTDGDNLSSIVRWCWGWRRKRGSSALRRGAPREGKERPAENRGARELFFAAKQRGLVRKVYGTFAVEVLRHLRQKSPESKHRTLSDALRMTISERERRGG